MQQPPSVIFYDPLRRHVDSCPQGPFFVFNLDDLFSTITSLNIALVRAVCVCSTDIEIVLERIHDLDQVVSVYICKCDEHQNQFDQNSSNNRHKVKRKMFRIPLKWLVDIHLELSIAAARRGNVNQEKRERQNAMDYIQQNTFNPHQSEEEESTPEDEDQ